MLMTLTKWVDFTNVLQADFTQADPKSTKKCCHAVSLFALLESSHKMLVKSIPGEHIIYRKRTKMKSTKLSQQSREETI